MGSFKHNRKRNSGLVYEFLVRRLGQSLVEHDKKGCARALDIMRRYYSPGAPLAEERELFEVIRNARGLTESAARRIMAQVSAAAVRLDHKKLDIKKSCLIKELNLTFGQGFFAEHRVPEYRLLASIQQVVDACQKQGVLTEDVARIQLEEGLVQYMTTRGSYVKPGPQRSEVDALVMRMAAKRFGEKYSSALIPAQKRLLEKFIRYQATGDSRPLMEFIAAEERRILAAIEKAEAMKEVREDQVMSQRLAEAKLGQAVEIGDIDKRVEVTMLYQKLAGEIESDE